MNGFDWLLAQCKALDMDFRRWCRNIWNSRWFQLGTGLFFLPVSLFYFVGTIWYLRAVAEFVGLAGVAGFVLVWSIIQIRRGTK